MEDGRSLSRSADALVEAEKLNTSLGARLAAYRKSSARLRPDFARAYDELVERLNVLDRDEVGPALGEPMPEFGLPDEQGRLVLLPTLL